MRSVFRCEYAGQTKGLRYELWREQFARRWLSADFNAIGSDRIANEVNATEHSFLGLCKMRTTPVRIERRHDLSHNIPGTRYLLIAADSLLRARQRGRSTDVAPGQIILMSAEDPAEVMQLADGDRWSIRLSQNVLAQL